MNVMSNRIELPRLAGLSHLVEAATALTKMDPACPQKQNVIQHLATQQATKSLPTLLPATKGFIVSDDEVSDTNKASIPQTNNSFSLRSSREIFPQRLMAILSDPTLSDVVSWLPHGRSFVIIRPDVFAERVLPKYLPSERSSTKYPSFTRKLNRWGFRQATRGPDTGAFHHPLFKRDEPHLCLDMVCQKSRKRNSTHKKKNKNNDQTSQSKESSVNTTVSISEKATECSDEDGKLSLPPKKRRMASSSSIDTKGNTTVSVNNSLDSIASQRAQTVSPSASCLEGQEGTHPRTLQSVSASAFALNNSTPLTSAAAATTTAPWFPVPNDPKLIAATLKAQEEKERLCIAKSMLYEAYIKALQGN